MKIPVVPVRIQGLEEAWPRGKYFPKRSNAIIKFGKPMMFTTESHIEVTKKIEDVVRLL